MEKSKIIEKLFLHTLIYSFLLLPITFLFTYKSKSVVSILIAIYGILFFTFNLLYSSVPKGYVKAYFAVYTYLEYLVFAALLWINIPKKALRKLILWLSVLFGLFQVFFYFSTNLERLDTIPIGIETILIFVFIFLFFYSYLSKNTTEFVYNNHCFWICIGVLIYLGGSFFLNIFANHVPNINDYWHYTYIAEVIKNILFSIAIIILARKPNQLNKGTSTANVPYLDII